MWKVPFYFNCDCDSVTDFTFTHSFSTRPFSAVVLPHFCLPFRPWMSLRANRSTPSTIANKLNIQQKKREAAPTSRLLLPASFNSMARC